MIDIALRCFRLSELGTAVTVYHRLLGSGYTVEDLIIYFEEKQEAKISKIREKEGRPKQRPWFNIAPLCPECNNPLLLRSINIPQGKRNIHGYRSHFYCSNNNCLYEKYSRISADYQMRKLLRKSKGKD